MIENTTEPWKGLNFNFTTVGKTMMIGAKNTGKSYFCEWIIN